MSTSTGLELGLGLGLRLEINEAIQGASHNITTTMRHSRVMNYYVLARSRSYFVSKEVVIIV